MPTPVTRKVFGEVPEKKDFVLTKFNGKEEQVSTMVAASTRPRTSEVFGILDSWGKRDLESVGRCEYFAMAASPHSRGLNALRKKGYRIYPLLQLKSLTRLSKLGTKRNTNSIDEN